MSARIACRDVVVRFGDVVAVDGVSVACNAGEVLAIVGENGAGKSTLMNAMFGIVSPTSGTVLVDDAPVSFKSAHDAIARGVGMVHQHFRLVPNLTVKENIALGNEPRRGFAFDVDTARKTVDEIAKKLGFDLNADAVVEDLSVGAQQRVEIAKALARGARALILDEPTAVLTPQEVDDLFRVVRALRSEGTAVLFISHKLDEVKEIADRIAVMRAGKLIDVVDAAKVSPPEIARMMIGRDVAPALSRSPSNEIGVKSLAIANVSVVDARGIRVLDGIDVTINAGEIVGVAGVEGNGQSELVDVAAGLLLPSSGRVFFGDVDITREKPRERFARGLAHIPGDRLRDAVAATLSVEENAILGRHRDRDLVRRVGQDRRAIHERAVKLADDYDVRPRDVSIPLRALSGGNQQKVVVGRELSRVPRVLLAAHPTRGVDVGAVEAIHARILGERARGAAVLLVSSDLNELLALSDRIVVLYRGRIVHETKATATDARKLGVFMLGAAA